VKILFAAFDVLRRGMDERHLTVLIVDDAPEERVALRDTLWHDPAARYSVIEAETGALALELCRTRNPDCVILNHRLPDLSGLEVLKQLGAEAGATPCAVVMLINEGDARLAVAAMRNGATDCLEKNRAHGRALLRAVWRSIDTSERSKIEAGWREISGRRPPVDFSEFDRQAIEEDRSEEVQHNARAAAGGAVGSVQKSAPKEAWDGANQKRIDEQFRLLKATLEQSAESVLITTAQLDLPGPQIVYANPAFTKMTGYELQEVIGKTPRILQGPKTEQAVIERLRADCKAGRVFHGETINYRKDGTEFYLEWSVGPVRNDRGEITHFVATQRDVTKRRRIENALIESEEQLRSLFELSSVGMAQVSREGRYLRVNRKFCQMLGYTEQELLERTLFEITHPGDREISAIKLNSSYADEIAEYSLEKRYRRKDGAIIWVLVNWATFHDADGQTLRTVANIQDITERKRAEDALRENEAQIRAIMDHSTAVIFVKDLKGRYLRVNRWYEIMHGLRETDVKGKTDFDLFTKELAETYRANDQAVLAANKPLQFEERNVFPDGVHYFISAKFPLYDNKGLPYAVCGIATDITERKRMEQELRDYNEQLRIVLEAARMGIFDWDIKGDSVTGNKEMRMLLGLPLDTNVAIQPSYFQSVVYPDDLDPVFQAIKRAIRQGSKYQSEFRVNLSDGGLRWIGAEGRVYYDEKNRPARMLGVAFDITERKQAEEALKASEERLDLALKSGDIGTFDWDIRTNEVIWTEKSKAIFGFPSSKTTALFEDWRKLVHPEDLPACELSIQEAFDQKRPDWRRQYRIFRADTGELRWVDCRGRIFYDSKGEPLRMIGTNIDATERKQAEEALKVSEERLRSLIEQASDGIFVANLGGSFTEVNRSACQMLGYSRDELIGKGISNLLMPEDVLRLNSIWENLLKDEAHIGEWLLKRKDGQYLLSEVSAKIFPDGRWMAIVRDITERKRAEADREGLLAREQAAREAAEAANRSKDEFLAVVSHELRSPLNAMLGYARLLRYGPLDLEKVKKAVEVIERNGKAQSQLIDDLLDTARIISGKLRLDVGPVELAAVIESAAQTIYPAADAKGITIRTDLPPDVGQITGDPVRLGQVVWNLLSNAVKFTPPGGQVNVRLERAGPHIKITVSDTGKGISPDFMPYIFDRFRQADASSARRYGGLGLGLTLVKHLVELHGGTIEVISAGEDKGASFIILLPVRAVVAPIAEYESESLPLAAMREATDLSGIRALVIDDEEDARELVKASLEQFGAEVVGATSASEGFSQLTSGEEAFDVIVTDLGMPEEDGYSLLRRMREWERKRGLQTPAIALTAYGQTEDRIRALMAGFQTHITKPVEPVELAIVIANLIKQPSKGGKHK
jgi:PAS domain S-box-containing protein